MKHFIRIAVISEMDARIVSAEQLQLKPCLKIKARLCKAVSLGVLSVAEGAVDVEDR